MEKIFDFKEVFEENAPQELCRTFGSPLYVYNESILRERCRELKAAFPEPLFEINYSTKANSNPQVLKVVREERFNVDAMSPGEILVEMEAGFPSSQILFICNNVSEAEMKFAIERNVTISVDSIFQLERFGLLNPGGRVAVRINPGEGAGFHENTVTAGTKTKFGIPEMDHDEMRKVAEKYELTIVGLNQHIGSNFLEGEDYVGGVRRMLKIAESFQDLEFIDFGGGFGIPYEEAEEKQRLDLAQLGVAVGKVVTEWQQKTGYTGKFKVEPGRYVAAEAGVLLGTVHSVKKSFDKVYIGTDLGFNVLQRPVMYDAYHAVTAFSSEGEVSGEKMTASIVGNICETGDYIAKERNLPVSQPGDIIAVANAGAYGLVMASNYNMRLRPAEIMIDSDGQPKLIRRRDNFTDLLRPFREISGNGLCREFPMGDDQR